MAASFTDETLEPVEFKSTWKRERYDTVLEISWGRDFEDEIGETSRPQDACYN